MIRYLIVFALFIFSFSAFSQSGDSPGDTADESAQAETPAEIEDAGTRQEQQSDEETATSPGTPDFDVFQPSEDISEDLAVPFPADI